MRSNSSLPASLALLAAALVAANATADSKVCGEGEDREATELMARIEARVRATTGIAHMQLDTHYREGSKATSDPLIVTPVTASPS